MATYQLPPPDPMVCTGNVATNWKVFKEAYEDYAVATELTNKEDTIQAATLKTVMGKDCRQILLRLELSEGDMKKPAKIMEKLQAHFAPTRNILYERYLFHTAEQQVNETADQYLIRLRQLAEPCKFGTLHDEMVRDRLVLGSRDKGARARLFREKECDLKKALETLQISESTNTQLREIDTVEDPVIINALQHGKMRGKLPQKRASHHFEEYARCKYCGGKHEATRTKCPAFGKSCHQCGKMNHFHTVCLQKKKTDSKRISAVQEAEDSASDSEDELFTLEHIGTVKHQKKGQFYVSLCFTHAEGNTTVECQLDTGATCNVMSLKDIARICHDDKPSLQPETTQLKCYDNSLINTVGQCTIPCVYNQKTYHLTFKVIEGTHRPLLSGTACIELGLITVHDVCNVTSVSNKLIDQYQDVFEGLGCIGEDYHIEIDETIQPVQHVPRRVPVAMKDRLKHKLDQLAKQGIITPVQDSTAWISNIVTIVKPGKIRVCIDPRDLNKAIKRPKYQMPTLEGILPTIAKAKVFTVLDAKDGFYQVKLDEASSRLTTFWTPFGRYRYIRMPFGISSAPEEFQRRMHTVLQGLPGVEVIADDILVYGSGTTDGECQQDHDHNLQLLLQRAREQNLKLNKVKLKLCLSEVSYMGHQLSKDGLSPDPMKTKAIQEMPRSENKKAVERFLGCLQYLSRFLPRLAEVAAPLQALTENSAVFTWQSKQEEAFNTLKMLITEAPVLKFYNVTEEATIQCDASEKGLGATLLQKGQPVAFASRSLTPSEQNYAQIEKECLAIVFACERFNQYIHGRLYTTIHTDHRPLVPIFTKPIFNAPKRLQRMLLRLQKYSLKVQYCPGKEMYIADMLSRAYLQEKSNASTSDFQIFSLRQEIKLYKDIEEIDPAQHVRLSKKGIDSLKAHTAQDEILQQLISTILRGWPDNKRDTPLNIRTYWPYRDELTTHDSIVYKGTKVLVPKRMQPVMLQRVHTSHQGPEACVRRAKDVIFWPGMTKEIRHMAEQCHTCNEYAIKQQKEPLIPSAAPPRPWAKVAQDLFSLGDKSYLITVDYYSDFWEIDEVPDTTSDTIVSLTKAHFARYGIPEKVITDNGPQFRSKAYEEFANQWEFDHVTSSSYHSQSNGKAEAAVKIAKCLLKKVSKDHTDIHLAVLAWRNTPTEGAPHSPAQRLHSRRTRTRLPTAANLLLPEIATGVTENIQQRRHNAKTQYDKHAKILPELQTGHTVRIQPNGYRDQWKMAKVIKKVGIRSYLVRTPKGQVYRRNRKHLRATTEAMDKMPQSYEDGEDEFAVSGTADQLADEALPHEEPSNIDHNAQSNTAQEEQPGSVEPTQPSSRYNDYVKL